MSRVELVKQALDIRNGRCKTLASVMLFVVGKSLRKSFQTNETELRPVCLPHPTLSFYPPYMSSTWVNQGHEGNLGQGSQVLEGRIQEWQREMSGSSLSGPPPPCDH